jgi:hypothetical protein
MRSDLYGQGLGARRRPPPSPLLENLTNIRRSLRNPTQHPEKVYVIDDVQDLFGLCVDVIRRMSVELWTEGAPAGLPASDDPPKRESLPPAP